ncbi:hypothetical protein HPB47_024946 [Ixodes persulcatus]|uniref:Uncharacterized protein n=1 Tax=Ixodes persulcatus TaxID=34615 RepID=A0AC60Q330_IXOPE|nr:hypothetical protein HPB47_024946 [Ixodes persulcatus]
MPVRQVTRGDYGRCPVNLRRKEKAASEALLRSRMHDRLQDPVLFSHWDRNIPRGDTHLQENSGVCALHFDERYIERYDIANENVAVRIEQLQVRIYLRRRSKIGAAKTPRSDSIQAFRGASWRQISLSVPRAGRRSTHPTL